MTGVCWLGFVPNPTNSSIRWFSFMVASLASSYGLKGIFSLWSLVTVVLDFFFWVLECRKKISWAQS